MKQMGLSCPHRGCLAQTNMCLYSVCVHGVCLVVCANLHMIVHVSVWLMNPSTCVCVLPIPEEAHHLKGVVTQHL